MIRSLVYAILLSCVALAASAAEDDICRSVSTSWDEAGQTVQTRVSTEARDGCKRIWHGVDGTETEGRDCNCDLVADGMETRYAAPPSPYQSRRLYETCLGPSTTGVPEVSVEIVRLPSPASPAPRIILKN